MVETFFSELRFSVNRIEGYGFRHEEDRAGVSVVRPEAVDESVRAEIIETVRKFVQREVIPVASDLEHGDTYPDDDRRPDARPRPLRHHHPGGATAGSASTC